MEVFIRGRTREGRMSLGKRTASTSRSPRGRGIAVASVIGVLACARGEDVARPEGDVLADASPSRPLGAPDAVAESDVGPNLDAGTAPDTGTGRSEAGAPGGDADGAASVDAAETPDAPTPVVCNAATCPRGCCSGNTCLPGTMDGACGHAGATCVD